MKRKENRLVVGDLGWADTLPDWLLEAIKKERMVLGLAGMICEGEGEGEDVPKVGNAEICAYLYTANLRGPMSAVYSQIYFCLGAKVMREYQPDTVLPPIMTEALEKGLTDWEKHELKDLRYMIYQKRGGEIAHPILDVLRVLKKEVEKAERNPQMSFL